MRWNILWQCLLLTGVLFAQEKIVRGKITYISTDAVYTSLGKNQNITDSTTVFVVEKSDTVAVLKVFALSSTSSACSIVKSSRQLKINDDVVTSVLEAIQSNNVVQHRDTAPLPSTQLIENKIPVSTQQQFMTVSGRISYQYFSSIQPDVGQSFSQPGIVLNLRGKFNDSPIIFDVYGNLRSLSYGTQSPFAFNGNNQTRIYRLSVEYDDTLNKISVGRIIPSSAPSIGYVDGGSYARTFGKFIVGLTAGFEPSFSQQGLSTEMKKFSVFGNYRDDSPFRPAVSIAYSRRYFQTLLDREVVNGSLTATPFENASFYSQTDVEIRSKSNNEFRLSPNITMMFASFTYRFSKMITAGLGYNVWRPTYSFASIQTTPDSLLDNARRSSLSVNVSFYLPYSISIYNSYLPRSSDEGFGKEYSNNSSLSASNIANSGVIARVSMNINSTVISSTRGFGAQFQRNFVNLIDISLRYQSYRYNIAQTNEITSTNSIALDVMAFLIGNLTLWGSIERQTGFNTNGYTIITELSWRL